MPEDEVLLPIDAAQTKARAVVYDALAEYAGKRVDSYQKLHVGRLLQKDLLMMSMRGVTTVEELLDVSLNAFESSSEETHMGDCIQKIATDLAERAIDLSDLIVEKDGDLWIVEVKSQTNTLTGRFRNALRRELKQRVDEFSKPKRARGGRVRALIGVVRGDAVDQEIVCEFPAGDEWADLNGFTYSYKVGKPFWEWLTGRPGIGSLIDAIPAEAAKVADARAACRPRLHQELEALLAARGEERGILAVLKLADEQFR